MGWRQKDNFSKSDDKLSLFLVIFSDIQLVVGLYLWFTHAAFQSLMADFGETMKDTVNRFFGIEHLFGMLIALVLVHLGRIQIKKNADDTVKFRKGFIYFGIALLIMLLTIPWPFMPVARPWFPGMPLG